MMREVKFRAWEPDTRKMVEVFGISPLVKKVYLSHQQLFGKPGDDLLLSYMPDEEYSYVRLMQFTGLLDKNSVEIYEGDIVEEPGSRYEVVYHADGFYMRNMYEPDNMLIQLRHGYLYCEVIGNIYESTELLANQSNKKGE